MLQSCRLAMCPWRYASGQGQLFYGCHQIPNSSKHALHERPACYFLEMAEEHFNLSQLEKIPHQIIRGDVFEVMRGLEQGYDIVVLDPPPFAKRKGHLPSASRGYKDLNLWAFRLLNKGGILFTFSCSHHMSWELFQKIIFSAALDSGRNVQLLSRMGHPWDHPINLYHPEGEYLRGLICKVA